MRILYTFCFYCLLHVVLLRLWWRGRRAPEYRLRWAERFGFFAPVAPGGIWVHAVSLGETIAALPLIKALQSRYPERLITVTTTTPTGSARVRAALGDSVHHVYAPYDLPDCLGRFLRRVQPALCLIMETELWPNTLAACRRQGVPVMLVNARLSERSARGYARFEGLTRGMLGALRGIAAQTEADAERFARLGAVPEQLTVTGSIKFDVALDSALIEQAAALREALGAPRPVVIAASTHRGEDEIILAAFASMRARLPDALLMLVPRHPERFDEVAALIEQHGLNCARRSALQRVDADTSVYLGDTLGELLLLYGAADVAFVGGSLVEVGGHNLLEPAALGVPLLSGPYLHNFADISRILQQAGALQLVHDQAQLAEAALRWLTEAKARRQAGEAGRAVVEANRGALERLLTVIGHVLPPAASRP